MVDGDLLNDRVMPFLEEEGVPVLRVLTDRGSEYCGNLQHHEYELYLAIENLDHTRTKPKRVFGKKVYEVRRRSIRCVIAR